jgi:hypothetical protein
MAESRLKLHCNARASGPRRARCFHDAPIMLNAAFFILAAAVLLGVLLAVLYLRGEGAVAAPWPLAALHAGVALGGFVCLLFGLRGPARGAETGTASFGVMAALLIAAAAIMGGVLFMMHRPGRRLSGTLIGVHATLAIAGFVILAGYVFAG